jgi:hypothetical protein
MSNIVLLANLTNFILVGVDEFLHTLAKGTLNLGLEHNHIVFCNTLAK